jgi:hypothetical protein
VAVEKVLEIRRIQNIKSKRKVIIEISRRIGTRIKKKNQRLKSRWRKVEKIA